MIYSLKEVVFSYNGRKILDINDLQLDKGKIYLISGANGAGKTTLLKILNGLLEIQSGKIYFKDEPMELNNFKAVRSSSVYVHQTPLLLTGTVYDNIAYGLKVRKQSEETINKTVHEMLELFNLSNLEKRKSTDLSGGEINRVAIARALALAPEVLLLDEPTAHVDKESLINIQNILVNINQKNSTTVIFSSHGCYNKKLAHEIILIKDGNVTRQC